MTMGTNSHGVDLMVCRYFGAIEHDHDAMEYEFCGATLHTFGTRTITDVANRYVGCLWDYVSNMGLRPDGRAFLVSVNGDSYSLWCGGPVNGVLYVPEDYSDQRSGAASILEEYSLWVSGEVYGYTITDERLGDVESCWGFIGYEHAEQALGDALGWLRLNPARLLA